MTPTVAQLKNWISLPPWTLAHKAVLKIRRGREKRFQRARDLDHSSYSQLSFSKTADLRRHFQSLPVALLTPYRDQIRTLSDHFLHHRFELLGSGRVQVKHGMVCKGFEGHSYEAQVITADPQGNWLKNEVNPPNLDESRRLWQVLFAATPTYIPIDWQRDFKSGYRWTALEWYHDAPYGHLPGVEVKVPWELARMQHLVQLAWAYALSSAGEKEFLPAADYAAEFRSQVLDFIAANPPRFGIHWKSSMDIAIRAANWLAAHDLFRAYGHAFDEDFKEIIARSLYEHADHIRNHLEWDPDYRGNHYLANLAGLLFAGAYLPASPETNSWLSFAVQELIKEVPLQFHPEGSNFEGSTSYHRFSAEICVYGTALAQRMGFSFPDEHFRLLGAMSQFTADITKADGHVCQIGDNDNGRFFKFFPVYQDELEDHLDHRHLLSACRGISFPTAPDQALILDAEASLVQALSGKSSAQKGKRNLTMPNSQSWDLWRSRFNAWGPSRCEQITYPIQGSDVLSGLKVMAYPSFGLYIFRSKRFFLAIRCGSIGQKGRGGHAHNDQLSVELQIDGKDIHRDPGSYVYTALPDLRNQYRSVRAHFAPQGDREPGRLDLGLFLLGNEARGECLYWGEKGFIGRHRGFGTPVYRTIELKPDGLSIHDVYENNRLKPTAEKIRSVSFSPGYGRRLENLRE